MRHQVNPISAMLGGFVGKALPIWIGIGNARSGVDPLRSSALLNSGLQS
jgi:hypothetical protein